MVLLCVQASAYIGADSSLDASSDPAVDVVLPEGGGSSSSTGAGTAGGESPVLPVVPFEACLNKFTADEVSNGLCAPSS